MIFGEVLTISAALISLSRVSFSLRDPRELVFAAGSRHHAADPEFLIVGVVASFAVDLEGTTISLALFASSRHQRDQINCQNHNFKF